MLRHSFLLLIAGTLLISACSDDSDNAVTEPDFSKIRYTITDLGTLSGGTYSQAIGIDSHGNVTGLSDLAGGATHAVVWSKAGIAQDIGSGSLNSSAFGSDDAGNIAGQTEIADPDPNNANFCLYFTGLQCRPVAWVGGTAKQLPLLGGYNGSVGDNINSSGLIPGVAETGETDPSCSSEVSVVGTGPQVLSFKPVIWNSRSGSVKQLSTLPGDNVGLAFWVNDAGQAVGVTGTCANTTLPPFSVGRHAVLWEADGSVVDLGNLGGTGDPSRLGVGNVAHSINSKGQVVGVSALAGNLTVHGFIWTKSTGMRSLDPLDGHVFSGAVGINKDGDVVGVSVGGDGVPDGSNPTSAVIWRRGSQQATDLNLLTAAPTPLILMFAYGINDAGEIVGFAFEPESQTLHAYRATPIVVSSTTSKSISERASARVPAWVGIRPSFLKFRH